MTYLLDTTTVSALIRRETGVVNRFSLFQHGPHVAICVITRGELLYGIEHLPDGRRKDALRRTVASHLSEISCIPVPESAADHYAVLRREAEARGTPMGENDVWIAATALALDATLVATDDDFAQCAGLRVEDWTR